MLRRKTTWAFLSLQIKHSLNMDITTRKITHYEKHLLTDIERFSLTFEIKRHLSFSTSSPCSQLKLSPRMHSHASGLLVWKSNWIIRAWNEQFKVFSLCAGCVIWFLGTLHWSKSERKLRNRRCLGIQSASPFVYNVRFFRGYERVRIVVERGVN